MKLKTDILIPPSALRIKYNTGILSLGSCFADRIGLKLQEYKFKTFINPPGILFDPVSLARFLLNSIRDNQDPDQIFARGADFYSYDFHSSLSSESFQGLLDTLLSVQKDTKEFLSQASVLILTLGTSIVYRSNASGKTVANCHKMPASGFEKEILDTNTVVHALKDGLLAVRKLNPELKVILTVSPVRHVKDTLQVNSVSKSILRIACHELSQQLSFAEYFPSFEIMNDDLRDYRFYKDDLIHPTGFAEDYIWERFSETYFDKSTSARVREWEEVKRRMEHKPFKPGSAEHLQFVKNTFLQLQNLHEQIDCSEEIAWMRSAYSL